MEVIIPDTVTSIGDGAFRFCTGLTEIKIPDSVGNIGKSSFYGCENLKNVTIGKNVKSIDEDTFWGCINLSSIEIPESVEKIGDSAFSRCYALEKVHISKGVKEIARYAFEDCKNLTGVYITDIVSWCNISFGYVAANPLNYGGNLYLNGELVTSLIIPDGVNRINERAFQRCSSLVNVKIPNSVSDIGENAFEGCSHLEGVYITDIVSWCNIDFQGPGANPLENTGNLYLNEELVTTLAFPEGITSIGGHAFYGCSSLVSVTIPDTVTVIDWYAFANCENLKSVTLGNGLKIIGSCVFSHCTGLTSIVIPEGVESIGTHIFEYCSALEKVFMPKSMNRVDSGAFEYCTNLKDVYVTDIASWCSIDFYNPEANPLYYAKNLYLNGELVTTLVIPEGTTSIGTYVFSNYSALTDVTIPDTIKIISSGSFLNCTGLTEITIPDSVKRIYNYAFEGCKNLTKVTLGNGLEGIYGNAFSDCTNLKAVYITDIAEWCSINFYNYAANPLYYAKNLYLNGNLITTIVLPDGITSIGNYSFFHYSILTDIKIPNTVTSIGTAAFSGCTGLTEITIPNSVTSIGKSAFGKCVGLNRIIIPESVEKIDHYAFLNCSGIKNVFMSKNIKNIGYGAFDGCDDLTDVFFAGSEEDWLKMNIDMENDRNSCLTNALIHFDCQYYDLGKNYFIKTIVLDAVTLEPIEDVTCTELKTNRIDYTNSQGMKLFFKSGQEIVSSEMVKFEKVGYDEFVCYLASLRGSDDLSLAPANYIYMVPNGADVEDLEEKDFVRQHTQFMKNEYPALCSENGFYNAAWAYENGRLMWAFNTWEAIGDIGEMATLKFDDLLITANYTDIFLSDMILSLTDNKLSNRLAVKSFNTYEKYYGKVTNNIILNLMQVIEKDELAKVELDELFDANSLRNTSYKDIISNASLMKGDLKKLLSGKEYEMDTGAKVVYKWFFEKLAVDEALYSSVLEGACAVNTISSAYTDTVEMVTDLTDAYILAQSCKALNEDIFVIFYDAIDEMELTDSNAANKFRHNLNKYYTIATDEKGLMLYMLNESSLDLASAIYNNSVKGVLKKVTYKYLSEALGISVASLNILTAVYNGTYALMDKATGLGDRGEQYATMNYVAPFEKALSKVTAEYGEKCVSSQSYESAANFDLAYNLLTETNKYLYNCAYKYGKLSNCQDDMTYATYFTNTWKRTKCHSALIKNISKYINVRCPVDVYLYDASGNIVVAVENEVVTAYNDDMITVLVYGGEKSFMYPADQDYSIKIVSREEGSMEYSVADVDNIKDIRQVEFYDLSLSEGQEYTGNIPAALDVEDMAYALKTNNKVVSCDYDSNSEEAKFCSENGHQFGEWEIEIMPSADTNGLKKRECSHCHLVDKESMPANSSVEISGVEAAKNLIYDGKEKVGFIGTPTSAYTGAYDIYYSGRNMTEYSSVKAPVNAGDYAVTISIPKDNVTYTGSVTLDFVIEKADQEAPKIPEVEAKTADSITLKTVADNSVGAKAEYSKDDGKTWQESPKFTNLNKDSEYSFVVRYKETANYNTSPNSAILKMKPSVNSVVISGVEMAKGLVFDGKEKAGYSGTPTSEYTGTYNIHYIGRNNTVYNSEKAPVNAGEYSVTICIPESDMAYTGSVTLDFVIAKAEQEAPKTPEVEAKTANSITLKSVSDSSVGSKSEYSKDGGKTWQNSFKFTNLSKDTEYSFVVRYKETANYNASPNSAVLKMKPSVNSIAISGVEADKGLVFDGKEKAGYSGTPTSEYTGAYDIHYIGRNNTVYDSDKAPVNAGEYSVTISIPESDMVYTGSVTLAFAIAKAEQEAPNTPEVEAKTADSITLKAVADSSIGAKAEYSKDGGKTWQESPKFTKLDKDTEYSFVVRYAETINYKASPNSTVLKMKPSANMIQITGVKVADNLVYDGNSQTGYSGTPTSEYTGIYDVHYIGRNNTVYDSDQAPVNAGEYSVTISIPESDMAYTGSVTLDFVIAKADQEAPKTPEVEAKTEDSITLKAIADNSVGAKAEYSKDGGKTWQESPKFTNLNKDSEYSFVIRYKELSNYKISPKSAVLKVKPSANSIAISGVEVAQNLVYDGKAKAGYNGTPTSDYTGDYEIHYTGRNNTMYDSDKAPVNSGEYIVTISIPGNDGVYSGSIVLAFAIAKAEQEAPGIPEIEIKGADSITLKAVADSPVGAKAEYSKDGGKTWQERPKFMNLSKDTEYSFAVRYAETYNYFASTSSNILYASTLAENTGTTSSAEHLNRNDSNNESSPKTGDSINNMLLLFLQIGSALVIGQIIIYRRKKTK